jgi:hypothetical protein
MEPLWRVPRLVEDGDPVEMAEVMTSWQVDIAPLLVPSAPTSELNDHAVAVAQFVAGLDAWKTEYLDRLAGEDGAAARQSLDLLRAQLDVLAADLSTVLEGLAVEASAELSQARQALAVLSP